MTATDSTPETTGKPSALAQLGNLFVAPSQALDYADRHPKMWWLPFGITLVLSLALGVWVAFSIDLEAWRAVMVQIVSQTRPEAAKYVAHAGRGTLLLGAVGTVVGIAIVELLYALYLFFADKMFSANSRGYGRWFSFTAWVSLPVTLGIIACHDRLGGVKPRQRNTAERRYQSEHASLPLKLPATACYKLAQFSILQFWVIGLVVFGLKRWCGHGTGKALADCDRALCRRVRHFVPDLIARGITMKKRKWLVAVGIAALVAIIVIVAMSHNGKNALAVTTIEVAQRTVKSSVLASGQFAYKDQVELRSQVAARSWHCRSRKATTSSRMNWCCRIDPKTYQASVDQQQAQVELQRDAINQAQLRLANLKLQWQRNTKLYKQGLIDANSYDN